MRDSETKVNTVNFRYVAGDSVTIKGMGIFAVVTMSAFDGSIQYQVMIDGGAFLWLPDALVE